MTETSQIRRFIRSSLMNAAVYGVLADIYEDDKRAQDFARLRELQLAVAKQLAASVSVNLASRNVGRFSISLALFRLSARLFRPERVAGILRRRYRRFLSLQSDHYLANELQNEATESMELLDRLSHETLPDGKHLEHGSLVTRSGALRAAVLGINDGLVSNTTLTLGVAAGTSDASIVLLAGVAGLVGGALSMAAGEYISVVSQREFNEDLVRWEKTELLLWHDQEEEEIAELLETKGLAPEEAKSAAARIMSNPDTALEFHVREELGIDPEDLGGSPMTAAWSSLFAFAIGAFVPLIPYAMGLTGVGAIMTSAIGSGIALILVGGGLGWMSGSGKIYGAVRMLAVGLFAGAITFGLGALVGQQLG